MRNLIVFLLFCCVFTGTAKATLSERDCSQLFIRHLQECELANRACTGFPVCIETRKRCNFNLDTAEACEDYEKCVADYRVERIKSMELTTEETDKILSLEGCSYYMFYNMGLKSCNFERKSFSKKRINLLECPGFSMGGLDSASQDYRHRCDGRDKIYRDAGKQCEEYIAALKKECPDYRPAQRKTLIKDCKFDKTLLGPPIDYSDWKESGMERYDEKIQKVLKREEARKEDERRFEAELEAICGADRKCRAKYISDYDDYE